MEAVTSETFQRLDKISNDLGEESNYGWKTSSPSEYLIDTRCFLATKEIIDNKYKVKDFLGQGSFGRVYLVKHLITQDYYAMKMPIQQELNNELNCLNDFRPPIEVIDVRGVTGFIMQLRGRTLLEYIKGHKSYLKFKEIEGKVIHPSEICLVAIEMLNQLQYLHKHGWIHRDIKHDNILFGNTTEDRYHIYLVDMGLAQRYCDGNGMPLPYSEGNAIKGNKSFMSLDCHTGKSMSPKDDMESLAYMLLSLLNVKLPWSWKDDHDKIIEGKKFILYTDIWKGVPVAFKVFLESVRELKYGDKPDYNSYRLNFEQTYNCIIEEDPKAPRSLGQSPVLENEDWTHDFNKELKSF